MNTPSELFDFYETYLNIYEDYKSLTGKRLRRVMQKAADLEGVSSRFQYDPDLRAMAKKGGATAEDINTTSKRYSDRSGNIITAVSGHNPQTVQARERQNRRTINVRPIRPALNASVEYVLDYLIDEGFTDSYESAIAIVESMSDEWLEGIIDERTRYAKETGKSFTSGRRSEKGGLMKPTGDVHADVGRAAMLHVIKNLPPDTVRAGASRKAIPGGGVGSRQTKKVRGEKVPTTPRGYMTTKIKNYMRRVADYNIGSPFD